MIIDQMVHALDVWSLPLGPKNDIEEKFGIPDRAIQEVVC
jgi:hypothetical protein